MIHTVELIANRLLGPAGGQAKDWIESTEFLRDTLRGDLRFKSLYLEREVFTQGHLDGFLQAQVKRRRTRNPRFCGEGGAAESEEKGGSGGENSKHADGQSRNWGKTQGGHALPTTRG